MQEILTAYCFSANLLLLVADDPVGSARLVPQGDVTIRVNGERHGDSGRRANDWDAG